MPQEIIDQVNTLRKADGMPSQLTLFHCEGRLVESTQDKDQADIQVDKHKITGVPWELDQQINIEVDKPKLEVQTKFKQTDTLTIESESAPNEQVPNMLYEPSNIPEEPIGNVDDTPILESGRDIEIPQLHQSTHVRKQVERLEPTMQGKIHWDATVVTPEEVDRDDESMGSIAMKQIFTQLSLKWGLSE